MSKIEIKNTSCLDEEVDVVVNAANIYLASGGGVCGAIFAKAGYEELKNACSKIDTPLNDGDAVITPAFNITNAKFIINAVGPNFGKTPNAFDKLFNAYYNSLKVLKDNNLHSISFPLISSGIFAGNIERPSIVSAEHCLKAYNDFINEYKDYDIDVYLCAYSNKDYEEIKKSIF